MSDSCNPRDCSPPGYFVHGISQSGILEWVAISFFKGSSPLWDQTYISCVACRFFTTKPPGTLSLGSIVILTVLFLVIQKHDISLCHLHFLLLASYSFLEYRSFPSFGCFIPGYFEINIFKINCISIKMNI